VYMDVTAAFPLLTAYVLQNTNPKPFKRLYDRAEELHDNLVKAYLANNNEVDELKSLMDKL
ncbi:MAG: hypothetical protein U1E05_07425, partial [Patescibacteria group bacterium]|nr:hypothetical protein [Patescibacteria group bacterium]